MRRVVLLLLITLDFGGSRLFKLLIDNFKAFNRLVADNL